MTELAVGILFVITVLVHRYDSLAVIANDLVFVTMLAELLFQILSVASFLTRF